jgi:hypothetical protein
MEGIELREEAYNIYVWRNDRRSSTLYIALSAYEPLLLCGPFLVVT